MRPSAKFGMATALLVLLSLPAPAAEVAILRNGFSLRHQRHEARDTVTRLYLGSAPDNYVEVPSDEIAGFEPDDAPPPSAAGAASTLTLDEVVAAASTRNYIDRDLISSMIRAESGFNPRALSPKGAQGLMQLMPATASRLGVRNAMDPAANVEGGTRYLRELLARYHNDLIQALAAYNAGPQRVAQYRGVPPYRETHAYVARVIGEFNRQKLAQRRAQHHSAAPVHGAAGNSAGRAAGASGRTKATRPAAPQQSTAGAG